MRLLAEYNNLPLTETISTDFKSTSYGSADASLFIDSSGLISLHPAETPSLYTSSSYQYRSSQTASSLKDLNRFAEYVLSIINRLNVAFDVIVEFGGNDLALASILSHLAAEYIVVDPVADSLNAQGLAQSNISVSPVYDHEFDLSTFQDKRVLVLSRHTFEHLESPSTHLHRLSDQLPASTLYIYEFPCVRQLFLGLRFDAIFHQHLSYLDFFSFGALLQSASLVPLECSINYLGSCGGSLRVAFASSDYSFHTQSLIAPYEFWSPETYVDYYQQNYRLYRKIAASITRIIESTTCPFYGYGASLMLPTFFYHSGIPYSLLHGIIDDDKCKDGLTYSNVPLSISLPNNYDLQSGWGCLVTSLESSRSIARAAINLSPIRLLTLSHST